MVEADRDAGDYEAEQGGAARRLFLVGIAGVVAGVVGVGQSGREGNEIGSSLSTRSESRAVCAETMRSWRTARFSSTGRDE